MIPPFPLQWELSGTVGASPHVVVNGRLPYGPFKRCIFEGVPPCGGIADRDDRGSVLPGNQLESAHHIVLPRNSRIIVLFEETYRMKIIDNR